MNIQTITKILIDAGIETNEAKKEIKMLLEHFCHYTEKDRLMGIEPDSVQLDTLKKAVLKRAENRLPVQYIIGQAYFMGEFFKVTPDVLIPRDETEILTLRAIEIIRNENLQKVLDIGTGTGCIACTIAKRTNAYVMGIDISSDALRVALDNVTKLGINNRAVFRKSDLFEKIHSDEKFDIIVSNPPYIPRGTILDAEVMHEPALALYADDNGLEIYKKIIKKAPEHLNPNGWIAFETGIGEAEEIKKIMEHDFENILIEKDLAGIERVVSGKLKQK